jgi:hypothetical protein
MNSKTAKKNYLSNKNCMYGKKHCIHYDGKRILYSNKNELINKLKKFGIPSNQAKLEADKLLKDKTRRFIVKDTGEFEEFDIKDNFKGMLKTNFNINRIPNKKIVLGGPIKNTDIVDDITRHTKTRSDVRIVMYVQWYSDEYIDIDDLKDNNDNIDPLKIQHYVNKGNLHVRKLRDIELYGNEKEIEDRIEKIVESNAKKMNEAIVLAYKYNRLTTYTKKKYGMSKYFLGDEEYTLEEWANIEYLGKWRKGEDSCAVKFVSNKFPHLYWNIKDYETNDGVSYKDFKSFCENNNIMYSFKNINGDDIYDGNDICSNIDKFKDIDQFNKLQILCAIVYEGHIYPYSGGKLKRISTKPQQIKLVKDASKEFINFHKRGILPRNVNVYTKYENKKSIVTIQSFICKGTKYFENDEYDKCVKILEKFKINKCIPTNIRLTGLINFILSVRKEKINVSSFLPEKDRYKAKAITWETSNSPENGIEFITNSNGKKIGSGPKPGKNFGKKIIGIDKNKCFPYDLCQLPYLIIHDWRKHYVKDISNEKKYKIKDEYLYLVKAKYFSIPIPKSGLYPGYHLNKYNFIDIELLEELETDTCINFYRDIIIELYHKMDVNEFKLIGVNIIGKMERDIGKITKFIFKGIVDKDKEFNDTCTIKIGDHNIFLGKRNIINNVRDQIPINIQIKCHSYSILADKIKEQKLDDDDIVQINTDSIFYYGDYPEDFKNKSDEKLRKNFNGWKKSGVFKSSSAFKINFSEDNEITKTCSLINNNNNQRVLYMKYAGNGKTHFIVNKLVKLCIINNKSYIVLTPTHSTLNDTKTTKCVLDKYTKVDIKCDILQKYCFDGTIPDVDVIIIDEIGFCGADCHDFIYKLNEANKSFFCFGDFNQMPPINETRTYNQPHYLKYMFNKIDTEFVNFRNNFTKKYYDDIINGKLDPLVEVHKYSSAIDSAEICICFRKETRDIINKKILKLKGLKEYSIGTKVICTTNNLLDTSDKYPIYHHKEYVIFEVNVCGQRIVREKINDKIKETKEDIKEFVLSDSDGNKIIVKDTKFYSNFRHSYCINIYEAQGKTFESYHWASRDNNWLSKKRYSSDNMRFRVAYTLISRITHKGAAFNGKLQSYFNEINRIDKLFNKKENTDTYQTYVDGYEPLELENKNYKDKKLVYDFLKYASEEQKIKILNNTKKILKQNNFSTSNKIKYDFLKDLSEQQKKMILNPSKKDLNKHTIEWKKMLLEGKYNHEIINKLKKDNMNNYCFVCHEKFDIKTGMHDPWGSNSPACGKCIFEVNNLKDKNGKCYVSKHQAFEQLHGMSVSDAVEKFKAK